MMWPPTFSCTVWVLLCTMIAACSALRTLTRGSHAGRRDRYGGAGQEVLYMAGSAHTGAQNWAG